MGDCTLTDLENRLSESELIQLTDDADAGEIDTVKTDWAIAAAGALIAGYLRGRYLWPLVPAVPTLIQDLWASLAIFLLFQRKQALAVPDDLRKTHDEDLALLDKLQKGLVTIDCAPAKESNSGSAEADYRCSKTPADRYFTDRRLRRIR